MQGNRVSRREFIKAGAGGLCALALGSGVARAAGARRPNVVFILSDDQNTDTIGCFGGKALTPNIDRMAKEGVKFTRAYAVTSVCTPSRYECLTGQYASRNQSPQFLKACPAGEPSNVGFNVAIMPETLNLGSVLRGAGYATGFVGKWHTGMPPKAPYPPGGKFEDPKVARALAETQRRTVEYIKSCGFDYAASVYRGNLADHKLNALTDHNQEWVTKGALDFIEQYKDRPFFLHMCTTLQHSPFPLKSLRQGNPLMTPAGLLQEAPQVQPSRKSVLERVRAAGLPEQMAHATWLDDGVGAVMRKVEEIGQLENTLFIFFSDNATMGGKGTCYDGGAQTPCLMMWKGKLKEGAVCGKLVQNTDFAPTILEACGVTPPAEMKLDGASVLGLLSGKAAPWRDTTLLEVGHTRAVVHGKWKYIALRYPPKMKAQIEAGTWTEKPYHMDNPLDLQRTAEKNHPAYWDADQLYDLENDPQERKNLARDPACAQTLEEMKGRLKAELAKFDRPFGEFR